MNPINPRRGTRRELEVIGRANMRSAGGQPRVTASRFVPEPFRQRNPVQALTTERLGPTASARLISVTRYRFLDGMGDVVDERDFADHAVALTWARDDVEKEDEVQRVEFLGPEGDWRWAGPLLG